MARVTSGVGVDAYAARGAGNVEEAGEVLHAELPYGGPRYLGRGRGSRCGLTARHEMEPAPALPKKERTLRRDRSRPPTRAAAASETRPHRRTIAPAPNQRAADRQPPHRPPERPPLATPTPRLSSPRRAMPRDPCTVHPPSTTNEQLCLACPFRRALSLLATSLLYQAAW